MNILVKAAGFLLLSEDGSSRKGAFGQVYQAVLEDQCIVAVIRFIHNIQEKIAKELTVHCEINHKNVVRLIGYCIDGKALTIVTEYIPEGNLSDVLHRDDIPFPLDTRLRIAIECAEALSYMHWQMCIQVIHGDINPANILLDEKLRAKISDFAMSRLVNTDNTLYTQNVIESVGYMDPLFSQNDGFRAKSDVYSFGVVLLELITRKKARIDDVETSLVGIFSQDLARGINRVRKLFDAEISNPCDMKIIEEIANLSGRCLRMELHRRPEMLEVAECLRKLREALHQRQERTRRSLFYWGWKRKTEPAETSGGHFRQGVIDGKQEQRKRSSKQQQRDDGQQSSVRAETVRGGKLRFFVAGSAEMTLQLEVEDLFEATGENLGKGTVGTTYMADPLIGPKLAVKRLKGVNLPENDFQKCVSAIRAIRNEHVAPLRGYYFGDDEKLLLYDYMPMGSLAKALHGNIHLSISRTSNIFMLASLSHAVFFIQESKALGWTGSRGKSKLLSRKKTLPLRPLSGKAHAMPLAADLLVPTRKEGCAKRCQPGGGEFQQRTDRFHTRWVVDPWQRRFIVVELTELGGDGVYARRGGSSRGLRVKTLDCRDLNRGGMMRHYVLGGVIVEFRFHSDSFRCIHWQLLVICLTLTYCVIGSYGFIYGARRKLVGKSGK
ncbi:hypothetical protein QYE76_057925 [Lolium multiflorum]|uniref:Protein kinase domain-containing protein n=1 Tax=Lolium multiflorum TaxID=4521 RepID=A0AAD8T4F9_LOLMU|nr:hypothetical protein QYE76_057925 [Lolium multiflorum]